MKDRNIYAFLAGDWSISKDSIQGRPQFKELLKWIAKVT